MPQATEAEHAADAPGLPSYLRLYETGELQRRRGLLIERLTSCDICPRLCVVDRLQDETGFCSSPRRPLIASVCAHRGEEPPISGRRGSGTIFFANCNLRCVYCQNHQISQEPGAFARQPGSAEELADVMLRLQEEQRCHNINLVSPTHFVPQIVEALCLAVPRGLRLPLVYNTNAFDSVETLRLLDGIIDVYLPDIQYSSNRVAAQLSGADDYVGGARSAIAEMFRQMGAALTLSDEGTVARGLIVRNLVLPGGLAGSDESLTWLAA
ncbi:MAG: radical SAM protein, partial [Dehalococcoidia bacterium]